MALYSLALPCRPQANKRSAVGYGCCTFVVFAFFVISTYVVWQGGHLLTTSAVPWSDRDSAPWSERKGTFDVDVATKRAHQAAAAYCYSGVDDWTCPNCLPEQKLENIKLVTVPEHTLSSYVGIEGDTLVVVIRGSDGGENFEDGDDKASNTNKKQIPAPDYLGGVGHVHNGYSISYAYLRPGLIEAVHSLTKLRGNRPFAAVSVTGHSLGGAVATLAALDLSLNVNATWLPSVKPVSAYTFGALRTLDIPLAKKFDATLGTRSWRIVTGRDYAVHYNPPDSGYGIYRHVAREVWYTSDNDAYVVCDASGEDPKCSYSLDDDQWNFFRAHTIYMGINGMGFCPTSDGADAQIYAHVFIVITGLLTLVCGIQLCRTAHRFKTREPILSRSGAASEISTNRSEMQLLPDSRQAATLP